MQDFYNLTDLKKSNPLDPLNNYGLYIVDTYTLKRHLIKYMQGALGKNIDLHDSSPTGLLLNTIVELYVKSGENIAECQGQLNPDLATGVWLDAICSFLGIERKPALKAYVIINCICEVTTIIPKGARVKAKDKNNNTYEFENTRSVNVTGMLEVTFKSIEYEEVPETMESVEILTPVDGWGRAEFDKIFSQGSRPETDEELRARRKKMLSRQSMSTVDAIKAHVFDVDGVTGVQVIDNPNGVPLNIQDVITLDPHSIWVCVKGGKDKDIANALYHSKTAGAGYNGKVEVIVTYLPDGETPVKVKFDRPVHRSINVKLGFASNPNQPIGKIKKGVYEYFKLRHEIGDVLTSIGLADFLKKNRQDYLDDAMLLSAELNRGSSVRLLVNEIPEVTNITINFEK